MIRIKNEPTHYYTSGFQKGERLSEVSIKVAIDSRIIVAAIVERFIKTLVDFKKSNHGNSNSRSSQSK